MDAFQVRRTERLSLLAVFPGTVEFHRGDGSLVKCSFAEPNRVECDGYQVYLRDRAFYDQVNALIFKKEGRPTDILSGAVPERVKKEAK